MFNLNKQVDSLENIIEKIERKIEMLETKQTCIEEYACDEDRELTKREWDTIYKIMDDLDELRGERDAIYDALDYLRDYTEY